MSLGELTTFNAFDSYPDGIVRGFKRGLLTRNDYDNLVQCSTLEDLKMFLQATDYSTFLSNVIELDPATIVDRATQRMVEEFNYLLGNAGETLREFLEYIRHPYMIDNIVLILSGTSRNESSLSRLLEACHPLGMFEELLTVGVATTPKELYELVLIESPVGRYFRNFQFEDMQELKPELIRSRLYKAYLEDFFDFCTNQCGSTTGEVMRNVLSFEADRRAISTTLFAMSPKVELTKDDVKRTFPSLGLMYPFGHMCLEDCKSPDDVRISLDGALRDYREVLEDARIGTPDSCVDACFDVAEIELNRASFDQQFHYGIFFSYFRLKYFEIKNLEIISESIYQDNRSRLNTVHMIF